jgi:peptidyl-tRNA hydrolase, PTH1 family
MHKIKLFVGLGNPGEQYLETRHNVGFWWIDFIGQNHKLSLKNSKKYFGEFSKHNEDGEVFFLKPSTFMNDSGKSVQTLAKFYKIEPEEILVIHDELDIQPGTAKLKLGGGHGGHNGLKSIQTCLGSNNFWRLRIGVGHPGDKNKVIGYVLNKPSKIEMQLIQESIINSYKVFSYIMLGQFEKAMLNLHSVN